MRKARDPHRAYLDAEFSDEEKEVDDRPIDVTEELKTVYKEEELESLVESVKGITTLAGLRDFNWTPAVEETIREFLRTPSKPVLTIYFFCDVLTAELDFPSVPVYELNYFSRQYDEIFRADNFHDTILFGSCSTKAEWHMLTVVRDVVGPMFLRIANWPETPNTCVKSKFYASLDRFLCDVTDLTFKMLGLTVIYIPLEGTELTVEQIHTDNELVKRLEAMVVHWSGQIKIALSDHDQATPSELLRVEDEYDFWVYRHDNLCGLEYQLQKPSVLHIVSILTAAQSTYPRQFSTLRDEIENGIMEATSNIEYLNILRKPSMDLLQCTKPAEIIQHVPKLIHLIRAIWLKSPYYNSHGRVTNLFEILSHQIVMMCQEFTNLDELFLGKTRSSMEMFQNCIQACEDYKTIYHKIASAHVNLTEHPWDLDSEVIFRYIDIFIERCHDLLEICQAMIDFARMDEVNDVLKQKFSGTKGEEHEGVCQKIERLFLKALDEINEVSYKILDVHEATWTDDMANFRSEMKDLEIIIENLAEVVFTNVNNVQEGIDNLRGFYNYMNRESLKGMFDAKTALVWKLYGDDIQLMKKELIEEREQYCAVMPYYAGRALNLLTKAAYAQTTRNNLKNAAWMPYCSMALEVSHQETVVTKTIEDMVEDIFNQWLADVGENPRARLDRSLMRRCVGIQTGLLESNCDGVILDLCREASAWIALGFEIPIQIQVVYVKWENLKYVYDSVQAVTVAYNKIIEALSPTERELFYELIRDVDRKIHPGLNRLTWNTDYVDQYIEDCFTQTTNLQDFIHIYKKSNFEVIKMCEHFCDTPMISLTPNRVYILAELETALKAESDKVGAMFAIKYNTLLQYVMVIYNGFHKVIDECRPQWNDYLDKLDALVEEAFKLCLKNSMNILYEALHGDGSGPPSALLMVQADLIDNKISFKPILVEISTVFGSLLNRLLQPVKKIPRLTDKFEAYKYKLPPFWKRFVEDSELVQLQQNINNEANYCFTQVQNYLKSWEPFKDIWEINKDLFIARYEKLRPTVATIDADITKYADDMINVQEQDTVMTVHFLDINSDRLKATIAEHCTEWQDRLLALLLRLTQQKVYHVFQYIAENTQKITKEPTDLVSMQVMMALYDTLIAEIPKEEEEFPTIVDQFDTLEKHEIPLTFEFKRKIKDIDRAWAAYLETLEQSGLMLRIKKEEFRRMLLQDAEMFKEDIMTLLNKFKDTGPFTWDWGSKNALKWLANFQKEMKSLRERENRLKSQLSIFGITQSESQDLALLEKDVTANELIWQLAEEWETAWELYRTGNFWSIEIEQMDAMANVLFRKLTRLSKELKEKNWEVLETARSKVDKFRRTLPLITDLKNPSMRPRHWQQVRSAMNRDFDEMSSEFTLDAIADMQMQNYAEQIADISNAATMELAIEKGLQNITAIWSIMKIDMTKYKDQGIYKLQVSEDITQALEEHQVQLSAMKSTRFVEPFAQEVDYWERSLSKIGEVLEMVLVVQRNYMYMDNIFGAEDIRRQLPRESDDFDKVRRTWIEITSRMAAKHYALTATHEPPTMLEILTKLNDMLENVQRALEQYLETKRHVFPRFYFISNDDLLEILANSRRPDLVQPHIRKLFENIKLLKLSKSLVGKFVAEGMSSHDGEYVEFNEPVLLDGQVERYLCRIESAMRDSLREVLRQCRGALRKMLTKRDKWVKEWPSQPEITSTQIQWTADCTRTLLHCKMAESKKPLRKLRRKQNQALSKYSEAIRGTLTKLQRLKFKSIVVIEIHARDVIDKMYKMNCKDVSSFEWLSQLRFYWDRDIDDCIVRQTNTYNVYGYEYLGNSGRLVITPLTDRCYITLTTALHLYRGGSPKGPAGTGKTETVKDLGKALGFNVIVVNCSEGLDYKSMGRLFSGLSQTGAWGCFDEFNRINIEVLSVVAQQILSILTALSQKLTRFVFEGCEIGLVHTCGIFITMNPGYAGRTELPDNLKSMFRPISMMVPDSSMIAEINLFGEGFEDTRLLARKVYTLYSLAQQQLSKQYHYDFGLRGIVTLTRYAGKKKRMYPNLREDEVLILAMKDMNVAKLTTDDLQLFMGISTDLFPTTDVPTPDYEEFIGFITEEVQLQKLQPIPMIITKVIDLYETKNSRHAVMMVGQSNTAKTSTWKVLQQTMTTMKLAGKSGYPQVHVYPMNPKALNLGELYGEYNLATGEWLDGVISSIMRKTCSDESPDEKWILFDGPVDAVWIENMNSVMDDNKLLTLINNERIAMPEQVSLLFEVEDLAVASPATVSRAGMVYNDYKDLGWRPLVHSWLQNGNRKPEFVQEMNEFFELYIDPMLEFKRHKCSEPVIVPELNAMQSLCKLLEILVTPQNGVELGNDRDAYTHICRIWFLFCMIWSLCCSVNEDGRQKVDNFVRELEGVFPLRDTIYEYYVDSRQHAFVSWEEKLSVAWKLLPGTPFYKITVPTVDTVRYDYIVGSLLANGHPVLLLGPVGTGKTSTAQSVLESLDDTKYSILVINMSAHTTSNNVQETIESRLEKRTKGVYVPMASKTMITFMDDFNMPMKDTYGSQPPLELIRQWIGYGFWYDRQKQTRTYVQKMQLIAAMGPPGGGRNFITNRLLTRFNVINMTFPVEKQIIRIYGSMLQAQLAEFQSEVKGIANEVTSATIHLYNNVTVKMLPTPTKMHYLFNLRDISKVFQGLLRSHKDYQYSRHTFLRLWIHETFRVFSDRLIDEKDREWFVTQIGEQLGRYFELTFPNLCPDKRCPIFGDFMNAYGIYEDFVDMASLRKYLEQQMDEYNGSPGVVRLDLILFRDAIEHVCRIVRVISPPRGNMLLVGIGGSGRQSLSRVASYMSELTTFQIEVTKQYKTQEFREDLKSLYTTTGVENKPTAFLFNDTQVAEESFLEIINNLLSTGEVANLFKPDELEEIKQQLMKAALKAGRLPTTEAIYTFLIERSRNNMHVVLCMSPIGDDFRNRLRQYPSLINCTTIDWFLEWPREALLEVGNKFLMNLNLTLTITGENKVEPRQSATAMPLAPLQERLLDGIAWNFALFHDTVCQFSKRMAVEMKRYNYVTPTNFLELVTGYKVMLAVKRLNLANEANKLRTGLQKIDETRVNVNEMAAELEITQQQVQKSSRECEEFLGTIVVQRRDADETQTMVTARSLRIGEEQKECKKLEAIARADLATVEPALAEAMKALDALNKKDLSEIKSFTRPPPKVEMVMEAVMILKNSEPSWAESKRQLGDVNFINTLRDFDKDHISERVLKTIGKYTSNPDFDPIKVGVVSTAAKSLCLWVMAMEKYGKLFRIVAPKREKLYAALASLAQKEAALAEAMRQLEKIQAELERLQLMYDEKMREKEELIRLEELLILKLERAAMLVDGLSGERIRWEQTTVTLGEFFDYLPGDCLISTAFVSYLGPFVSEYREELINIWMQEAIDKEIPMSPNLDVKEFLTDAATIREWNIQGLPSDGFSTENGIIVTRGTRWPLVIDPQTQAVKWIKNMEKDNGLRVIDFGRTDFIKVLEKALQFGKPVLLENVGETLDPVLNPILQKAFVKSGETLMIKFNEKMITYNEKFRLFMTTKLPNPHYSPEISTKTTLCNFAIKEQGLEAQLLGIVVRKEKPQLEEQKDNLVLTIANGKKTLKDLEDRILYLLTAAKTSLLEDLDLLNTLQTSKTTSISVEESLVVSEETEKEIDSAREGYRACAHRASILFFILNAMHLIDPMYQFSLDAYISLFMISIEKSPKSLVLEDRIDHLNDYHTYAIYRNTCRGLFEHHKLLFSFEMCIKILNAQGKLIPGEYAFLLRGGVVLDRENQPDKPVPWLPAETWDNVTELDKLPGFHGLIDSFEQFPRDWCNWYVNTEPENIPLVGEWEESCNEFQKMLVIRSCRADRVSFCIRTFIIHNLGQMFVEPPVLDLKAVLDDSTARTPLIFVLSPGVDPTGSLITLADGQEMGQRFMSLSLGQGQAPIATRMIQTGAREGSWVFLANCHLSLTWMPKLDKIVETLGSSKTLHLDFRLWLSSSPTPEFPISILQAGIKMTTEPPKGLKANMTRLYSLISDNQFDQCQAKTKYKKLLFALVFFHAVLLERKKFQQLGWNVVYSFNDSDFEVSENLLEIYLDEYPETPWDSLKYLVAGVCYGGHVTDDWDRRLLMTYVQQYFNDDALLVPNYRLSSLPTYYIPRDGSLESYRDFIGLLPNIDRPEAFGQHPNADITCLIMEARSMFDTLMSLTAKAASAEDDSNKENRVMQLAEDILTKIPSNIDYENTEKLMGATKTPLDVVLLQEITRYNILLSKTRNSLVDLRKGIRGLVVMSSDLEEIFTCMYEGRVPSVWLTAYPSLKLLGAWNRDLISRVEHFSNWAITTHPPILFWLAAYTFPTGFLTAVLQTSARQWNVPIDTLSWEFSVFTIDDNVIIESPADGVYVRSVFLEGGGWDKRNGILVEPAPMQLIYNMPVIHFRPAEHVKKKTKGLYVSPCYYYPQRSGDQGRAAYVVSVDLKTGPEGSDFWVKRGSALLLSLAV